VVISGSALALTWADKHVNGILQAFYPGALGGQAIAEIISGKVNPSGKLPVTFYRSTEDLPEFWDYNMTGRTYRYFQGEALYPFGFGLSYSRFSLEEMTAKKDSVKVKVKGNGKGGREVLQVYVESPNQKERYRLCGILPVELSPRKTKKVKINLSSDAFKRRDWKGDFYDLEGPHTLHVGFSQPDERSVELSGVTPLTAEIVI